MDIFNAEEFSNLTKEEQQKNLRIIHQTFLNRRSYYSQIRNNVYDVEALKELNQEIIPFEDWFNTWHKTTQQHVISNNIAQCVNLFNQANEKYNQIEGKINEFIPGGIILGSNSSEILLPATESFNENANNLLGVAEERFKQIENNILEKINSGINDVLKLKQELQIASTFQERIKKEYEDAPKKAEHYLAVFILILIVLMALLITSFFINELSELPWHASLTIRFSIALPLIWIAHTLYINYKYYKVAQLKFDHLHRLLGGGASTITRLFEDDEDTKKHTFRKLSDLFLKIDDLIAIYSTKTNPSENSKEYVESMLKEIKSILKDIKDVKNIEKSFDSPES